MSFYKFSETDIFYNQIEATPKQEFFIHNASVFYNKKSVQSGAFTNNVVSPTGTLSLFEMNVDRNSTTGFIYPYTVKDSNFVALRTVTDSKYHTQYGYGQKITGSYELTSSITRQYFAANSSRRRIQAVKNRLNRNVVKSVHYSYSSSLGNKDTQAINLISVPNIFYGGALRKGTIMMDYYITGTLVGQLKDINSNGELIQVGPSGSTGSGSVAGVVLYDEGLILLTGSWSLSPSTYSYPDSNPSTPKWLFYGTGMNDGNAAGVELSSSYGFTFEATNYVPNITMFCHAPKGELDFSNNPTYIQHTQSVTKNPSVGKYQYTQQGLLEIKNTVTASYTTQTASFEKQTFISKIGIYDDENNLIGVASLSKPVKKTLNREFTFKLKVDV